MSRVTDDTILLSSGFHTDTGTKLYCLVVEAHGCEQLEES